MKKLIFFLLLIPVLASAQTGWHPGIENNSVKWDSIKMPITDTTVVITKSGIIAPFNATITFKMTGLDSSVIVHPGGASSKLSATVYAFHKFMNDSFPYTLSRLKWVKTTNGVSQNEKAFPLLNPIGELYLGFYLKNSGCTPTIKYLKYQVLFTKP